MKLLLLMCLLALWTAAQSGEDVRPDISGQPGVTYQNYGSLTYGSDGTSYQRIGGHTFGSDGSWAYDHGSVTTHSDGQTWQRSGIMSYGSGGTICTTIGDTVSCR